MIQVVYYRDINRLSISGHAKSGEVGHDLVCAAASILSYTLAAYVNNLLAAGQVKYARTDLADGTGVVSCDVPKRYKSTVTHAMDAICGGFELLSHDYPDNISYEIRHSI